MEPIPQVPKINLPACPDTSHILNEEFKQYLSNDVFPKPIADNLEAHSTKFSELKSCGEAIVTVRYRPSCSISAFNI